MTQLEEGERIGVGDLRPEVLAFAALMEQQLRANDHKPGWKNSDPYEFVGPISNKKTKIWNELLPFAFGKPEALRTDRVRKHAADVANYAMMIVDACGGLKNND